MATTNIKMTGRKKSSNKRLSAVLILISITYGTLVTYINLLHKKISLKPTTRALSHLVQNFKTLPKEKTSSTRSTTSTNAAISFESLPRVTSLPLQAHIEKFEYYTTPFRPAGPMSDTFTNPLPPAEFAVPLPLRTQSPSDLRTVTYPRVSSCRDIPQGLPVDPGFAKRPDSSSLIFSNVKNEAVIYPNLLEDFLPYTPVDSDPFLPWIHDVFSSRDGARVNFVAQNKRRCNTGSAFFRDIWNLEAQVAVMQPVAVRRVDDVPDELWKGGDWEEEERFQLSPLENADDDGRETRFLCYFHSAGGEYRKVTLSRYQYNLEFINWRKRMDSMLTSCGKDNSQFWLSTQQFYCPIPQELKDGVVSGQVEGRVFLDLVPMRVPPRFGELFIDGRETINTFNATKMWKGHVLPKIEASGRWANLPVCRPPPVVANSAPEVGTKGVTVPSSVGTKNATKPHFLVGCLWVSASYATRHDESTLSDIPKRMLEWLEFHLMVGFDHFYIYDNSAANNPNDNDRLKEGLKLFVDIFGADKITYVSWPFRVCNNNRNNFQKNKGERSSQYAAESSCRERYGSLTEWMTTFDPDEYFIPRGRYTDLKTVIRDIKIKEPNRQILSFTCTRALMRYEHLVPYYGNERWCPRPKVGADAPPAACLAKDEKKTYLATFNCEDYMPGTGQESERQCAKKQIYRPEYVLSHFIHYSPVTKIMFEENGRRSHTSERNERDFNIVEEAMMLHAKTRVWWEFRKWDSKCREECKSVGFVWPVKDDGGSLAYTEGETRSGANATAEGYKYNCWKHKQVDEYWVKQLKVKMKERWIGIEKNRTQSDFLK
eukprot:CAMPEP_0172492546 /NCGR_PEP_ID=MMETSP1066-20121228/23733_1 /TAXON_ID=671091 /ORGANISM="Coscinodiscus wailesii, Strain CCMP2513" /LENGTH=825 /DNA_ID=CAMNT_0013262235 /DNA_START=72 /DNA_END=2549 /DNA_ORIENTATION=-